MSFFDEVQRGILIGNAGSLISVLHMGHCTGRSAPTAVPYFVKSSQDSQLNQEIRRNGSRLGVIMFRTDGGKTWKHIMQQVTKGLQGRSSYHGSRCGVFKTL